MLQISRYHDFNHAHSVYLDFRFLKAILSTTRSTKGTNALRGRRVTSYSSTISDLHGGGEGGSYREERRGGGGDRGVMVRFV